MSETKTENQQFQVGDPVDNFQLPSTAGTFDLYEAVEASSRGVVVYFYPRANTPGCTTEACDFRDNLAALKALGYAVVGVSPDPITRLEGFRDKQDLNFPLGADEDHRVMEAWGAWGKKNSYGKILTGVIRSTVVVGKDRRVKLAQYNVRAKGHVARLYRLLEDA